MQGLVLLTYFFKSYQRKTFGGPPLGKGRVKILLFPMGHMPERKGDQNQVIPDHGNPQKRQTLFDRYFFKRE